MLNYVDYDPRRHAGQTVYTIENGVVRRVTDPTELTAAQTQPDAYVVLAEGPDVDRAALDAQRRLTHA
jgi:hypothetical protein